VAKIFTITQASTTTGVSPHTLRYYERIGLIDAIAKNTSGRRQYTEKDIEWIIFLSLFRSMGMSIQEMRRFTEMKHGGLLRAPDRRKFLEAYRADLIDQIKKRQKIIELVNWKIDIIDQKIVAADQDISQDNLEHILQWKREITRSDDGTKEVARAFAGLADAISADKATWRQQQALTTSDFIVHTAGMDKPVGFEEFKRMSSKLMAGFPNFHHQFESQTAEGIMVANRILWSSTHEGTFNGIAPTHRAVHMTIFNVMRIEHGKVAELWRIADISSLLKQIES